jgi:hypothetical protein
VSESKLTIKRAEMVNSQLQINSQLWKVNHERGYNDIDTIRAQVAAHERLHTQIAAEALCKDDRDPAPDIEPLTNANDREALVQKVDNIIKQRDDILSAIMADHSEVFARLKKIKAFNRPGKILLFDSVYNRYIEFFIPNIAELGGD